MIEQVRRQLSAPAPWIAIAGLMVSGTIALIGFWQTFSQYRDNNVAKIVKLETIVQNNSEWRVEQEKEHKELIAKVNKLEGQLNEIEHILGDIHAR